MARRIVKSNELQLGDVIRATPWGYGTATVINIQDNGEKVTVFRPYVTVSDFSTSAGVIPYIGTEKFELGNGDYEVVEKYRGSSGRDNDPSHPNKGRSSVGFSLTGVNNIIRSRL